MSSHYKALARRTNPAQVPLFPLNGTVLLPGCDLPLNVFEPRYLNMVDDALKNERLIGMVQSDEGGLKSVGGLGRIIQFSETDDGRYLIVLKGLKRFSIISEAASKTPYRQANVSFDKFEDDSEVHTRGTTSQALAGGKKSDRAALTLAMKNFAKSLGVEVDWNGLKDIPLPRLIDQAAMISPFQPEDKQSLLEAADSEDRRRLLIGLMHLYASVPDGGTDSSDNRDRPQ